MTSATGRGEVGKVVLHRGTMLWNATSEQRAGTEGNDPEGWQALLPGGTTLQWRGFYVGPLELTQDELADAARRLLGMEIDEVKAAAKVLLKPSTHRNSRAIIFHSATPGLSSLQGDIADAQAGRTPDDVATYVETRAVSLARPGDMVVGRTSTWRVAASLADVQAVLVPGIKYYYLSQAVIRQLTERGEDAECIRSLVSFLRANPDAMVKLYCLDLETQIVLLTLRVLADIPVVCIDANSPQVAEYWNTKAPLHPKVTDCLRLPAGTDPLHALAMETELAPLAQRLGLRYGRLPGYTVTNASELVLAANMLRSKYGIQLACLKPSHGGGGARISPSVSLLNDQRLAALAAQTLSDGDEEYVLESHIRYATTQIGDQPIVLNPSTHIRYGELASGATLQLTNGTSWQGNVYIDAKFWHRLGFDEAWFHSIRDVTEAWRQALASQDELLVTGGIDHAIGRVGGVFGSHTFVAIQDPNLSSHGAEYLRAFLDSLEGVEGRQYAASRVLCPTSSGTLPALLNFHRDTVHDATVGVIAAIPGRWGMIVAAARDPHAAVAELNSFEEDLIRSGYTRKADSRT